MSSYYDLDGILMEEEYVSVTFIVKANGVGVIDPGSEDDNVEQGANVDLPLWIAQDLFSRQAAFIKLPYFFSDRVRKEIQADAACVDLRRCCPYFYELGCRLVTLTQDTTLGSFLLYALQGRYKDMLCKAHTVALSTPPKFLPLLTREEVHMLCYSGPLRCHARSSQLKSRLTRDVIDPFFQGHNIWPMNFTFEPTATVVAAVVINKS